MDSVGVRIPGPASPRVELRPSSVRMRLSGIRGSPNRASFHPDILYEYRL